MRDGIAIKRASSLLVGMVFMSHQVWEEIDSGGAPLRILFEC